MKTDAIKTEFIYNLDRGNFSVAEGIINALIARHPDSPTLFSMRGVLYETMGKLKEAIKDFEKAWELDPEESEYLYWICEINLMFYDIEATKKVCRKGMDLFPNDTRYRMVMADACQWSVSVNDLSGPEKEEALGNSRALLDKCISAEPKNGEIRVIEGTFFLQEGDMERCLESFESSLKYGLELYGDYIDIGLILAILYLKKDKKDLAKQCIDESLRRFHKWNKPSYLKLFLHYEHLLLLREVYFGQKLTMADLEAFHRECDDLMERGVKVHHVTRKLRSLIHGFVRARDEGDFKAAGDALDEALVIFRGKLPLCIIFNIIKKPSLIEIVTSLRDNLGG